MRVLGVDPGSLVTGFGIVDGRPGKPRHVAAGTIRTNSLERGAARLLAIYKALLDVIEVYAPDAMSLERGFVAANVKSAFKLGEARAVAMLAAAERKLPMFEYTPADVKLTVAGHGRADKDLVKLMVRRTLSADTMVGLTNDAADALAIALCHLSRANVAFVPAAATRTWRSSARAGRALGVR
jgi:crossover junction endodeoxyribonuclease RuvC